MECSCEINGCGEEGYEECEEKLLTHNSPSVRIECGECGKEIQLGEQFEWYRGEYEGDRHVHHTCMDCLSLRFYFFGDWTFERIWDDFYQHMEDCEWQVPEACLSKVSPVIRAKVCEGIEKSWEYEPA